MSNRNGKSEARQFAGSCILVVAIIMLAHGVSDSSMVLIGLGSALISAYSWVRDA